MSQKTALVLLAPGFEEIEAVTVIDLLRRANINVTTAGLAYKQVNGSHDIRTVAQTVLAELNDQHYDALVLPGGQPGTMHLGDDAGVLACVHSHHNAGKICAAICAAPKVFVQAGIAEGKRLTSYPGALKPSEHYELVDEAVVIDGNMITSQGVGTAIAFSLAIIAQLQNEEVANQLAQRIVYST